MAEHSVATSGDVTERVSASYPHRALAGVIDALIMLTIALGITLAWLFKVGIVEVYSYDDREPLLTLIGLSYPVGLAVYLLITGTLGATVGMRLLGLRIMSADGQVPSRVRLLGRAAVLTTAVCAFYWLVVRETFPDLRVAVVPLAYSWWMLFNRRGQLPHDQLAGTVVVRRALPMPTQATLDSVRVQYGELPSPVAKVLLGDLEQLRRRARGALHLSSVPIFVLGLIALGGAAASWRGSVAFVTVVTYWALAPAVGLVVTAWWFRLQQRARGTGTGVRSIVIITVVATLVSVVSVIVPLGGVLAGAGFLAVALTQRDLTLGSAAAAFALVTALKRPWAWGLDSSTDSYDSVAMLVTPGSTVVFSVLALMLFDAAAITFLRERIGA